VGTGPKGVAVTPDGKTAFVANGGATVDLRGVLAGPVGDTVSTIDVKTRTKHPDDITGTGGAGLAITPDGKTVLSNNANIGVSNPGTVSTIDVKTRTKHPDDIIVG